MTVGSKTVLRTTARVEEYLRFIDRAIWQRRGLPQVSWTHRELKFGYKKCILIATGVDHIVETWRFSGQRDPDMDYQILGRTSYRVTKNKEGEGHPFIAPPTRLWVKLSSSGTIVWERLQLTPGGDFISTSERTIHPK